LTSGFRFVRTLFGLHDPRFTLDDDLPFRGAPLPFSSVCLISLSFLCTALYRISIFVPCQTDFFFWSSYPFRYETVFGTIQMSELVFAFLVPLLSPDDFCYAYVVHLSSWGGPIRRGFLLVGNKQQPPDRATFATSVLRKSCRIFSLFPP